MSNKKKIFIILSIIYIIFLIFIILDFSRRSTFPWQKKPITLVKINISQQLPQIQNLQITKRCLFMTKIKV